MARMAAATIARAVGGVPKVFSHASFRYLWLAQTVSVAGDRFALIAISIYVVESTESAAALSVVLAAQAIPLLIWTPVGGVWADRFGQRRTMIVCDLSRLVLHGALAAAILSGAVALWQVIVIEILFSVASAFFRPAAKSLLPETVPAAEMQQATAMGGLAKNLADFAGLGLGTAVVVGIGAGWAFAFDALTFLLSALLLLRVSSGRRRAPADGSRLDWGSFVADLAEGFREVRSHPWLWRTLAAFCIALFAGIAPWLVLGPEVAQEQYGAIAVYGVVSTMMGLGTVLGSVVGYGWRPRYPLRAGIVAILCWPMMGVFYALGLSLYAVIPLAIAAGAGIAVFEVLWYTVVVERVAPEKLSRVISFDLTSSEALVPLGLLAASPVAGWLTSPLALLLGSGVTLAILAAALLPRETRQVTRLP